MPPVHLLTASALVAAIVVAASQAAAGMQTLAARPFTSTLTYTETSHGTGVGEMSLGVEGRGTISMRIAGAPAGVPAAALARGGPYVVRYDIDAAGDYHGVMVVTAASPSLGSLCLLGDVVFGKSKPGSSFPPTSGSFASFGGTGVGARLRLNGRYKATSVAGSDNLRIVFSGTVGASLGTPKAPNKTCLAVAKLAKA